MNYTVYYMHRGSNGEMKKLEVLVSTQSLKAAEIAFDEAIPMVSPTLLLLWTEDGEIKGIRGPENDQRRRNS